MTRDNFGPGLAQVAGSALLIDYVLTVAVSVTSGVAALTTAFEPLQRFILPLSLLAIVLISWANLAGVRESGRIFAVPTYLFVGSCALMLLVGLVRQLTGHLAQIPDGQTAPLPPQTATVGLLLVLHAFAAGCTALTESIAARPVDLAVIAQPVQQPMMQLLPHPSSLPVAQPPPEGYAAGTAQLPGPSSRQGTRRAARNPTTALCGQ